MKKYFVFILLLSMCFTGCSTLVTASKDGILKDPYSCSIEDLQPSTNFIEIDSDILQGITVQNISKQDCILKTPPSITAINLDGKDVTKNLFNITLREANTDQDSVTLVRDGGIQVFTIRWKTPCSTPSLTESTLNLSLSQYTLLTLPKIDKKIEECLNTEEKIDLEITSFTSPP